MRAADLHRLGPLRRPDADPPGVPANEGRGVRGDDGVGGCRARRVLDVGAGTGKAALAAAEAGAEVVATDITPELLAAGERLGDGAIGSRRTAQIRFDGPLQDLVAHYKRWFGPVIATCADLDAARAGRLDGELRAFFAGEDHGPPGGPPRYELEYLLLVARRALSSTGAPAAARQAAPV